MLREPGQCQQQFVLDKIADHQPVVLDQQGIIALGQTFGLDFAAHQRGIEVNPDRKLESFQATLAGKMQHPVDMPAHAAHPASVALDPKRHFKIGNSGVADGLDQPRHRRDRERTTVFATQGLQGRGVDRIRQPVSHKPRIIASTTTCVKTKNPRYDGFRIQALSG